MRFSHLNNRTPNPDMIQPTVPYHSFLMVPAPVSLSLRALHFFIACNFPVQTFPLGGNFDSQFGSTFATLVIMSVLYPISNAIRALVLEKELRIKEGLKMMGLSAMAHTLSWIFHFMCLFFCVSASIMVFSGSLFEFR